LDPRQPRPCVSWKTWASSLPRKRCCARCSRWVAAPLQRTAAAARAVAAGHDYVLPEDVQAMAVSVLSHRLIVAPEARATGTTGEDTVREALDQTPVPV